MAQQTICQTPDAEFHIHIGPYLVSCVVDMPFELVLEENEAALLESNLHNAMELVLARYFPKTKLNCEILSPRGRKCCFTVKEHQGHPYQSHMTSDHKEFWSD